MGSRVQFGEGIAGWAIEHRKPVLTNRAHLDPRVKVVPGTPENEPEALVSIPLISRNAIKGALNIYRAGEEAFFTEEEFDLAKRFADAAALALDNAQIRARLEHQAQTDELTGLYNHRYFHERLRSELQRASRSHEPARVLRRGHTGASVGQRPRCTRRAVDRPLQDASAPRREADPAQRRARDRSDDRERAPRADRLPQLPRGRRRGRRGRADRIP